MKIAISASAWTLHISKLISTVFYPSGSLFTDFINELILWMFNIRVISYSGGTWNIHSISLSSRTSISCIAYSRLHCVCYQTLVLSYHKASSPPPFFVTEKIAGNLSCQWNIRTSHKYSSFTFSLWVFNPVWVVSEGAIRSPPPPFTFLLIFSNIFRYDFILFSLSLCLFSICELYYHDDYFFIQTLAITE